MTANASVSFNIEASARGNAIRWLILSGVVLIAGILIATAMMVEVFRERALHSAERELENTVLLLARHFDQQLDDFITVQRELATQVQSDGIGSPAVFKARMSTLEMHEALRAKISGHSDVAGLNVFDSDGVLINSSESWPPPRVDIADRGYFKAFKSGSSARPVLIELVQGRFNGGWATVISYRVSGPEGEFLGLVTRAITPASFEKFFASVALGEDAAITMYHRNGTLLARYPHIESMIGQNFSNAPVHRQVLANAGHGTIRMTSSIDGRDRLASARALTEFPISIIATETEATALADWRNQIVFLVAAAGLSVLLIAAVLFLVVRKLSQQHQLEKQRLDTAINNMTQGLLLFDASQRLVVCNQRYVEMFGVSTDVVKPGCTIRELLEHRRDIGNFKGNVEEYCSTLIQKMAEGKLYQTILDGANGGSIQVLYRPLPHGGWVATLEDITERRRAEERITHLAHYDALTDLPNRVLFRERIERELRATGRGRQFALLYIDVDEFKGINDSLGHHVGDELLKAVAGRLRSCVRETDHVARLGGDEFAVIQTDVVNADEVAEFVARIQEAIRQPYQCLGHHLSTDASIGIALAPQDGTDLDQLIKNADLAMYGAKADGRRTYRFFEPAMDARAKARLTLERDIRQALVDGGFEIHYQPLVDLVSDEVTGCEALLRWRHPVRGMVSPADFVPVAEDTGLIVELGEWVLRTACAEAATWPNHIRLAVNVSPVQLKCPTLALKIASALATSGLPAGRLELEITEAVLIRDDETALAILHQLRAIGIRIALDDFGTGYSSLSYLKRFPFDKIKIDRCFVTDIAEIDGSSVIVQAVVNIAAAGNMTTTAEGVETLEQKEMLRKLGCTEMQGYLFSAAKPGPEVRKLFGPRRESAAAVA